jgi:hypothetical protein
MPPAELEHRLRLDHEEVRSVVGQEAKADVLFDLQLLLLNEQDRAPLLGAAGGRDADPVLVRDRSEGLLNEEAVRCLELSERDAGIADVVDHDPMLTARDAAGPASCPWMRSTPQTVRRPMPYQRCLPT